MTDKLKENIIDWLLDDDYDIEEAVENVENAKITEVPNVIRVKYGNGVCDYLVVENDEIVEHLNPYPG